MKLTSSVAWAVLLVTGALTGCKTASVPKPQIDPGSSETTLRAAWFDITDQTPPQGEVLPPPEAPLSEAPATELFAVLGALDEIADGVGRRKSTKSPRSRQAAEAGDAVRRALALYGTSPKLSTPLAVLEDAARALEDDHKQHAPDEQLERFSSDLARVARGIAGRFVDLAERAGTPAADVAKARESLDLGDDAVIAGQYSLAISRFGGATDFVANGPTFDIELFEQNVRDALGGGAIGSSYVIVRDGILYSQDAFGDARTVADPPQIDQSAFKEMYIASISKTLSALALLQALDEAGLSINTSISGSLPSDWQQHSSIAGVTFKHLLTHRSGFNNPSAGCCTAAGQSVQSMREVIAAGTQGILDFDDAVYTNANFSLMRILIPQLTTTEADLDALTELLSPDAAYAFLYSEYVSQQVLVPAGVSAAFCGITESTDLRTLYYDFSMPGVAGNDPGNWFGSCGATGWFLSAVEIARVLAFLRYTDAILDGPSRQLMDSEFLGWLNPVTFGAFIDGQFGIYRAHGGDYVGVNGCAMNYPIRLQATLLLNSESNSIGGHACRVLRDAYDDAWSNN